MSLRDRLAKIASDWPHAKTQQFAKHPLAAFFKNDFKQEVAKVVDVFDSQYIIDPSVGKGKWADVPWLSILNPNITDTTQDGFYPVYIFKADGSGVYLSLMQGVASLSNRYGKKEAKDKAEYIKSYILKENNEPHEWDESSLSLNASSDRGRGYEDFSILSKYYAAEKIPDNETLTLDLKKMLEFYRQVIPAYRKARQDVTEAGQLTAEPVLNSIAEAQPLSKPFLLLAGISGTGKSRFVRQQAEATGGASLENYCLVSVRPDWHEPSDLLGYTTRLSGKADYVVTETLRFIIAAWKALVASGLTIDSENECPSIQGSRNALDAVAPYWLCLDEMNLAPVEQYFADYLSVIETRCWQWDDDSFAYTCDALLNKGNLQQISNTDQLRDDLGLAGAENDALWQYFYAHGIGIPFNLLVAGTVNMDETTHGFSRKVIDRALTLDFGEFFPNNFDDFFAGNVTHEVLGYPVASDAREIDYFGPADSNGKMTLAFLGAVNSVLKDTPFELAYRALNELLLAVACQKPESDTELQAIWDDFLLQKVLPRIDGDAEKLQQKSEDESLLSTLQETLQAQLPDIWEDDEATGTRPDFYRKKAANELLINCRSRHKLAWMQQRLDGFGFTSFWP